MKKSYKVYLHEPGPVARAMLQVMGLFEPMDGAEKSPLDVADVILVESREKLNAIYRPDKPFGLVVCQMMEGVKSWEAKNLPDNVFAITAIDIVDKDAGLASFLAWLEGWFARHTVPVEEKEAAFELPSDLAKFNGTYRVLVIDNNKENRRMAEELLKAAGQVHFVCATLEAAVKQLEHGNFHAVLTDMQMPLDKHFGALSAAAINPAQDVPYGFAAVFEFTTRGLPVAVVTDGNHHQDWVSAMFDRITEATVNGQKVLFLNHIGKRWDKALKSLMEP